MNGRWVISGRGTHPKPWTTWTREPESEQFDQMLKNFLTWASQGQHVRLEFIPDGVFDADADHGN